MSRSSKKGPFIDPRLLARIEELNTSRTKRMIKTWSRASTVFPEMVGPHDRGPRRSQARPRVRQRGHGRPQARRVRSDPHVPRPRGRSAGEAALMAEKKAPITEEITRVRAQSRFVRGSARKARVVLVHIRGKSVVQAACGAAVHAARRGQGHPRDARVGRGQRRGEPRSRSEHAARRGGLRGRGPDPQALAAPCAWPCDAHPQALVPPDRRPAARPQARGGRRGLRVGAGARPRRRRSRRRSAHGAPARPLRPRPRSRPTRPRPPRRRGRRGSKPKRRRAKAAADAPAAVTEETAVDETVADEAPAAEAPAEAAAEEEAPTAEAASDDESTPKEEEV